MGMQPATGTASDAQPAHPAIEAEDLSRDPLLMSVARISLNGVDRPILGGIQLVAKLGQGGMGAVYYGINPRLETEVAIKILPLAQAQDQKALVERFIREARIAARVKSPHIAAVYDVNMENGVFYIQMEYVDGASAGHFLRETFAATQRGLPETAALDICIAACDGLAAAHAEGIIHRDIKPDNIMLPRRRRGPQNGALDFCAAKLLDLGLARRLQSVQDRELTLTDTGMGTPGYMPPEQAQDAHSAREPADVYSLGATLYALLAGHAPYRGNTPLNVAMATINKPHEPIENTRRDLNPMTVRLIRHCLEKDPAARPANAAALLAELRECRKTVGDPPRTVVRGKPVPAPKPAPVAKPIDAPKPLPVPIVSPKAASAKLPSKSGATWLLIAIGGVFALMVLGALALAVMLILINAAGDQNKTDQDKTVKSTTEAGKATQIFPPISGAVAEVKVATSMRVNFGDTLVVLRDENLQLQNITSPRAGIVEQVFVSKNNLVTPQTPLVSIKDE